MLMLSGYSQARTRFMGRIVATSIFPELAGGAHVRERPAQVEHGGVGGDSVCPSAIRCAGQERTDSGLLVAFQRQLARGEAGVLQAHGQVLRTSAAEDHRAAAA